MNILIVDAQGIVNGTHKEHLSQRIQFALARFAHRVQGVTVHLGYDRSIDETLYRCLIHVAIEGRRVVSVRRTASTIEHAVSQTVNATELKVACRVDWRSWFNADTFSTWMVSVSEPFRWLVGLDCKRNSI